jgi:DNA-binding transcriptional ArsR family regulator
MSDPQLDLVFAALADPQRRAILACLTEGPSAVEDLAAPLPITAPGGLDALRHWLDQTPAHWEGSFDELSAQRDEPQKEGPGNRMS